MATLKSCFSLPILMLALICSFAILNHNLLKVMAEGEDSAAAGAATEAANATVNTTSEAGADEAAGDAAGRQAHPSDSDGAQSLTAQGYLLSVAVAVPVVLYALSKKRFMA